MVLHLGNTKTCNAANTVISDCFHEPSPSNSSQCGSTCRPVVCCTCTWRCMLDRTGASCCRVTQTCRRGRNTQRVVMLFVWKSGTPMRVANWWDMFFVFLFPCPHSCNKWCLKTWHSTKVDITMKEVGLFLYQTCGHIGMVYGSLWRGLPGSVQSVYMFQQGPSQPLPQDPVRAAEWLQARIPRSQRWKKATLRVQTCILMRGSIPT